MKKKFSLIAMSLTLGVAGFAAQLSPQQALQRASQDGARKAISRSIQSSAPVYIAETSSGLNGVYIFNRPEGGFIILSADDLCYPVLGYSYEGAIDPSNLPVQMKAWLGFYCDELEYVIENNPDVSDSGVKLGTRAERPVIAPMLKTKWDQGSPYNNDCPTIGGRHTYTGCVATSMAQVMNFFKYPDVGSGRVTVNAGGINSSMTLDNYPFDWTNMLDTYIDGKYNDAQAQAVATLMKACGYTVGMKYGTDASGAQSSKIGTALKKYFKYDPNLTYESRVAYSASEWEEKVYNSLAGGSPVIYGGQDPNEGGHSFVCDGYDKDGYFHFNWGWGGMSDGYFTLNALNPEALGTGGGTGGGFNFSQDCVFNIKKPTGEPANNVLPMLTAGGAIKVDNVSGQTILLGLDGYYNLGWFNETDSQLNLVLGGVFTKEGSDEVIAVGSASLAGRSTVTLGQGTYYSYINGNGFARVSVGVPSSLPNGTYKMTLSGREANHPDWPYYPVITPYGYPNYVMVTKSGNTITATSVPIPKITISSAEIDGKLFYRRNVTVKAVLSNTSEYELTCAPMVQLKNDAGVIQFSSGSFLVNINPGETVEKTWKVSLTGMNGVKAITTPTDFNFSIYNEMTGESMGSFGTVTMEPNPGEPVAKMSMEIIGSKIEPVKIGSVDYNTYLVTDPSNFTMSSVLSVTSGYFDSNVYLGIRRIIEGALSPTQTEPVVDEIWTQSFRLYSGEKTSFEVPIHFPDAKPGVIYVLEPTYYSYNASKSLGKIRFWIGADGSGVNEIQMDENVAPEYYSLQGVRIDEPQKGEIVIEKSGTKVSKRIF